MPATHVCFDFFGTLVDYDPSIHPNIFNAPHAFAERNGASLSESATDALWQMAWTSTEQAAIASGRECSMRDITEAYWGLLFGSGTATETPPEHEFTRLIREYLTAWTTKFTLREGVHETLTDLAQDHTLSIVSNTHDPDLVPELCERFALDEFFAHVFTSVNIGWRKPRPEIFAHVLSALDTSAEHVHFVGDNWEADIEGPRACGMHTWYVGAEHEGTQPVAIAELAARIRKSQPAPK